MAIKSLHEAGFSNEAIIACVRHNIHYVHELMKYYNQDRKLRVLNDIIADVKEEILQKCEEATEAEVERKSKYPGKTEDKNQFVASLIPESISTETTLEELVNIGVLSKRTWQALGTNNINDMNALVNHYIINKSFRDLRSIGTLKNDEASRLATFIIEKKNINQHKQVTPKTAFSFTAENVLSDMLGILFEIRKHNLKKSIVEFFAGKIIPIQDAGALAYKLNKLRKNPRLIPSMGVKGIADLQDFLDEYKSLCTGEKSLSDIQKMYLVQSLRKLAWVDDNWIASNDLGFSKPLQFLYNLIKDSIVLKNNEQFILRNVKTIKINDEGHGLRYQEALDAYNESQDSMTSLNTFKVWVNRARTKLDGVIDDILAELPQLKEKLLDLFSLSGDFITFRTEKIDELNEQNETDFSDLFFDLLISRLNKGFYSLNGPGKRRFSELAYIKNELISDIKNLENFLKILSEEIEKPSIKERSVDLDGPSKSFFDEAFDIPRLVAYLSTLNNEIRYENGLLIFPPTHERKMSLGELVHQVIEENGEPMHYDLILKKFREKFPEVKISSYRSLRDAMDKSDLISSMGGKSNHFLLNEWKAKYYVGPNKEFIIDFLKKKQLAHFFEIYRHLSSKRPGIRLITVTDILTGLSELFYNHKGGYYSLMNDNSVNKEITFPRMQKGIYNIIEKNKDLLRKPPELLKLLTKRYPEYNEIQFEYAMYQVSEKQV